MIGKWKQWLYTKFLPTWCREELLKENTRLIRQVEDQARELERLNAYIDGLESAMRHGRIVIQTGVKP